MFIGNVLILAYRNMTLQKSCNLLVEGGEILAIITCEE